MTSGWRRRAQAVVCPRPTGSRSWSRTWPPACSWRRTMDRLRRTGSRIPCRTERPEGSPWRSSDRPAHSQPSSSPEIGDRPRQHHTHHEHDREKRELLIPTRHPDVQGVPDPVGCVRARESKDRHDTIVASPSRPTARSIAIQPTESAEPRYRDRWRNQVDREGVPRRSGDARLGGMTPLPEPRRYPATS